MISFLTFQVGVKLELTSFNVTKKKKKRTCNSEIDHQTPNGPICEIGDSFPFALIFNTIIIDRLAGVGHATLRLYNEFYINQFKAHDFQHMFRRVPGHKNSSLIGQKFKIVLGTCMNYFIKVSQENVG